jgi:DNA polymerase elongation subunit (family B)
MIRIFFDIETYSPHVSGPRLCDKVISIAYKIDDSEVVVLKEWKLGEKEVLNRFLDVIQSQDMPNIIGHNILRFDIPVIVCRSLENGLGRLEEIYSVFREPYGIARSVSPWRVRMVRRSRSSMKEGNMRKSSIIMLRMS